MNRKTLIILGSCTLFAVAFVIPLYAASYKMVHEKNAFLREYQRRAAIKSAELDIKFNSWYLAGITADKIYLGNSTAPLHILMTDHILTDSQRVKFDIEGIEK